ncbi:tetratricopeptide repeat protein, partial [Wenjunlia tyrosinilytica]|uniref:tetratricopeptide repeat protein n=1 Tax=Wenjunlia tyrosinilytica TaxID=1544741 RepID=UPI00166C345C
VLDERERILGPHHPDTLTTRHNLAHSYRQAGRTDDAIGLEERVVGELREVLGVDHPWTIEAMEALADWRGESLDGM